MTKKISHRICIAPMLKYTDRHYRYLMRLMTKQTMLYTEMVVAHSINDQSEKRLLDYHAIEHPVALQLIGNDPAVLAKGALLGERYGYDEINLNLGCPSNRVKKAGFGGMMMADVALSVDCFRAMQEAVKIPVTVKIRLSHQEAFIYSDFVDFVRQLSDAGCRVFIIHARTMLNQKRPARAHRHSAVNYEAVYQLKRDFPDLEIVINGGIASIESMQVHLKQVDGVMVGQAACRDPYLFSSVDRVFFADDHEAPSRQNVLDRYLDYVEKESVDDLPKRQYMLRHIVNLFRGMPGANELRKQLAEYVRQGDLLDIRKKLRDD
ncbi:MAG: tRNA dihydrouridine(20/20a) synthase DusA [Pseudomonadota bacterium]